MTDVAEGKLSETRDVRARFSSTRRFRVFGFFRRALETQSGGFEVPLFLVRLAHRDQAHDVSVCRRAFVEPLQSFVEVRAVRNAGPFLQVTQTDAVIRRRVIVFVSGGDVQLERALC
jgi:hypothetical protein